MSTTKTALLWNTEAILHTPDEREIGTPMQVYRKGKEFIVVVGDHRKSDPEHRLPSDFRDGTASIAQSVAAWLEPSRVKLSRERPSHARQNGKPKRRSSRKDHYRASAGLDEFPLHYIECRGQEEHETFDEEAESNGLLSFSVVQFCWPRRENSLTAEPEFATRREVSREEVERMLGQKLR